MASIVGKTGNTQIERQRVLYIVYLFVYEKYRKNKKR